MSPIDLCTFAAGFFLVTGLVTGVWKYERIRTSAEHRAPPYVDIAHRAALMYSFAALVLGKLAERSPYGDRLTTFAAAAPLVYFALATSSYVIHGILEDTDNLLATPHKLGSATVPQSLMKLFMWSLIAGELGGTLLLLWGFVQSVWMRAGG